MQSSKAELLQNEVQLLPPRSGSIFEPAHCLHHDEYLLPGVEGFETRDRFEQLRVLAVKLKLHHSKRLARKLRQLFKSEPCCRRVEAKQHPVVLLHSYCVDHSLAPSRRSPGEGGQITLHVLETSHHEPSFDELLEITVLPLEYPTCVYYVTTLCARLLGYRLKYPS
eukprot:5392588-Pyramimonas_sp.AAC.1